MIPAFLATASLLAPPHACEHAAQDSAPEDRVKVERLTETAYFLNAGASNVGLFFGEDGILLVDSGFLLQAPDLELVIAELYFGWRERVLGVPAPEPGTEPLPYRYLITTHWHADHVEGNAYFGLLGAQIVSHPSTRRRLIGDPELAPGVLEKPLEPSGLPSILVEDSITLHFNGEEVRVFHLPAAHSDGDLAVWLPDSKLAFLSDLYWQSFPFIDLQAGGRPSGMLRALERFQLLFPPDTTVVMGHGGATGMERLMEFHQMLDDCDAQIRKAVGEGKTLIATYDMKMFGEYEDEWGVTRDRIRGFIQIMWYCYAPGETGGLDELGAERRREEGEAEVGAGG